MMRKAFTLLELLVVVGIMGLLGTVSIGAYRSVVRGMEERGAVQNASQFVRAAFQRAMIDRQPTAIYFWNETIRASSDDENEIVVGKAVAVRRAGRITGVDSNYLYDEFADLDRTYSVSDSSSPRASGMYLYQLDDISGESGFKRSRVYDSVYRSEVAEMYLLEPVGTAVDPSDDGSEYYSGCDSKKAEVKFQNTQPDEGKLGICAFILQNGGGSGGPNWAVGDAYGFEFQTIELPKNFIFGSSYSKTMSSPVKEAGRMVFGGGAGGYVQLSDNTSSTKTIEIRALRPNAAGNLSPEKVGETADPTKELE